MEMLLYFGKPVLLYVNILEPVGGAVLQELGSGYLAGAQPTPPLALPPTTLPASWTSWTTTCTKIMFSCRKLSEG